MTRVFSIKAVVTSRRQIFDPVTGTTSGGHMIGLTSVAQRPVGVIIHEFAVPADFDAPVGAELTLILGLDPANDLISADLQTSTREDIPNPGSQADSSLPSADLAGGQPAHPQRAPP